MSRRSIHRTLCAVVASFAFFALGNITVAQQKIVFRHVSNSVGIEQGNPVIKFDGKHFATLNLQDYRRPVIYPIHGPGETPMTRNHPMKKGVAGEADDHPHHKSIWCAHGLINGVSFWHEQGQIKVDDDSPVQVDAQEDGSVRVSFKTKYLDANEKLICRDHTAITFHDLGDARAIDWELNLMASEGDLLLGDTKEGMMAIRTHPSLRIDKGAEAVNAGGVEGKDIWGKNAEWVDYSGNVQGNHVGIAVFDHPSNLRHPTTWHARAYGLVAANPFGLSHFQGKPKGTGDHTVKKGETLSFKYRFLFHKGDAAEGQVAKHYADFIK